MHWFELVWSLPWCRNVSPLLKTKYIFVVYKLVYTLVYNFSEKGRKNITQPFPFVNVSNLVKWKHILRPFQFRKMKAHFKREPHFRNFFGKVKRNQSFLKKTATSKKYKESFKTVSWRQIQQIGSFLSRVLSVWVLEYRHFWD